MSDKTDTKLFSYFLRGGNGETEAPISSKIPICDQLSDFYNVSHKNRGIALIFNHEIFDDYSLQKREGSHVDVAALQNVLNQLGFDIRIYHDLNFGDLDDKLRKVAEEDHSKNDCLFVCVMSHGENGKINAKDHVYPPDVLWNPFTGDNCLTLAGKPKLFFIQACRGNKVDDGVLVRNRVMMRTVETDSSSNSHLYKIPAMADILVMYSTYQGYYAWRNPDKGSWFIQALCEELLKNSNRYDLMTMLTFVNRCVSLFHESNVPKDSSMHSKKQVCTIVSMLTRLMIFPSKNNDEQN